MKNLSGLTVFQGSVLFFFPQYQSVNTGKVRDLVLLYGSNNKTVGLFQQPSQSKSLQAWNDFSLMFWLKGNHGSSNSSMPLFRATAHLPFPSQRHFSYPFLDNLILLWCVRWASEQLLGAPLPVWGQSKEQAGLRFICQSEQTYLQGRGTHSALILPGTCFRNPFIRTWKDCVSNRWTVHFSSTQGGCWNDGLVFF